MSYLYTVCGYATLIGVGYAVYHVSTQKAGRRGAHPASRAAKSALALHEPRKEDRKKKQRMESFASEAQEAAQAKARTGTSEEQATPSKPRARDAPDDDVDNHEFSRQLAKAQKGTKLTIKDEANKPREKSVKQSHANQMSVGAAADKLPSLAPTTAASTKEGGDADKDESKTSSPRTRPVVDVSGVSDMLEPVAPGPSVLRVTDAGPEKQKPDVRAAKEAEKTETKKQRQNRKKAELAKAARHEAEKERKVLEEKQRRAARLAEGRAAKDGSLFQAANGASSAWVRGAPNGTGTGAGNPSEAVALHAPLDTLEQTATRVTTPPPAMAYDSSWISSLPSEEQQMEMLKDEADDWNMVKTKSTKKAAKKASSVSSVDDKAPLQQPTPPTQPIVGPTIPSKGPTPQNFGGSFSALTSNEEGAEEVEEEWDV